jgi:hypothetical protein
MRRWQAPEDKTMATGMEMLRAVMDVIAQEPSENGLLISRFDVDDLMQLEPAELQSLGVDDKRAEAIVADLREGCVEQLSDWLGRKLIKVQQLKSIIPGEGIRRTAGLWADEREYDPDALVEEIRQLRNPTVR